MKKISFLLALSLVVSSFPTISLASSEDLTLHTNIGFADCATFSTSPSVTAKGKSYVAKVVNGGIDKALILKNGAHKLTADIPVSSGTGIYYVQTRIKLDDLYSQKSINLVSGSTSIPVLNFGLNGNITINDNKKIGRIKQGGWMDITFKIDKISGKGDIYINGKQAVSRFAYTNSALSSILFESEACKKETVWYVDYIRSYTGNTILSSKDLRYELNNETGDDANLDLPSETKTQSQLVVGYDFEDDTVGVIPDGFWTKNDTYIDERKDKDGKAFKIARTDVKVADENYIDLLTNTSMESAIIEADIYNPVKGNVVKLFTLRDKSGNFATLLNLYTDGTVKTHNGIVVAKAVNKQWTNIAVALDFSMRTFSVYANRELVAEEVPIPNSNIQDYIQLVRFEVAAGANKEELWIDNMYVYTGDELQPFSDNQKKFREEEKLKAEEEEKLNGPKGDPVPLNADMTYFEPVVEAPSADPIAFLGDFESTKKAFKDAFCIGANINKLMLNGQKYQAPVSTIFEDMTMMIPVKALGAAYGYKIGYDSATGSITIGDDIKVKIGDTSFSYKDKTIDMSKPVMAQNGVSYIELRPFAEKVLNSYMYQSDYGVAVVSATKLGYQQVRGLHNYLTYDRPKADELYQTLTANYPNNAHPRVMFTDAEFARTKQLALTDANAQKWSATVLKSADFLVKAPLPVMAYDAAGLRLQNLVSYSSVLTLYWAYITTGDSKYADCAIDRAIACCEKYTTWGHNTHYLEVGEACAGMGLTFDLFYDELTQEEKDTIAGKIIEYGLKPSYERYQGKNPYNGLVWPTNPNNWNVVVNKGLIIAALAIGDEYETDLCMNILEKSLKSLEFMMPTFAPEGAWGEGPAYWEYAFDNCIIAIKVLNTALGNDYGISDTMGFKETGYYPFNMSGNAGVYAYHDTSRVLRLNGSSSVFYHSKIMNDSALGALQLNTMNKNGSQGDIMSLLYYDPSFIGQANELRTDCYYASSQVASVRSDWSANSVWMGIHAGANDFAHGHVDLGSFEYESNGVRFASEMGKDDYNLPGYWDTNVRNLYVTRAEGHNVYVINPDIGAGQEVRASSEIEQVVSKPQGSIYTIDMTPAYISDVQKATRAFMLSNQKRVFTVQDEILPSGNDEYYWFWHTVADVNILDDGKTVILTNDGRQAKLYFDSNVEFKIEKGLSLPLPTSPRVDGQLGNLKSTINKITVRFKSVANEPITFRATAVPSDCKYVPSKELTPIADWSIPDGPITLSYPTPEAIIVDGTPITGFNGSMTEYSVPIYSVPDKMPTITVAGVQNYSVTQPTMENPTAIVEIPSTTNPDFSFFYYVTIDISTSLNRPTSKSLDITSIKASAIPEKENPPENMRDKDFSTRWAAEGEQWAIFDLGETKTVSGFGLSVYSGLSRSQTINLLVSEDGENYTSVLKGRTSKLTEEMEYIEFTPVKARYVKFEGSGNSANAWNSVTEVEIFGQ